MKSVMAIYGKAVEKRYDGSSGGSEESDDHGKIENVESG